MLSTQPLDGTDSTVEVGVRVSILSEVHEQLAEAFENRRWFHANAELSFREFRTAAHVVEILRSYGITEVYEGIGQTGVVAVIRGGVPGQGPCVGLRADMDALPIVETADMEYKSQNEGAMHACGHDGHMASLLAAAKVIQNEKHKMCGVVKLIFQPAEEGYWGAPAMIKDGVLEEGSCGPKVDFIYGLHIWSMYNLGHIGCQDGPVMAAADMFKIHVKGKGGHGAAPQGTVDAIVEASALITSLQTIVSRNKDPLETGVVTCGVVNGGYGYNIIPDSVVLEGTCRSFTKQTQELIKSRMECICCGVAQTYGGEIDLDFKYGYPATVNSYPECSQVVRSAASKIVGDAMARMPQKTMGAEDFSFFLEQRPGCFFFVGAALPGDKRPHHKSVFDFDERAILIGASVFVQVIRDVLHPLSPQTSS